MRRLGEHDPVNPYIALADLCINVVLILSFFIAALNVLGHAGWERMWWRSLQKELSDAVKNSQIPKGARPRRLGTDERNDPEGTQRWMFDQQLFLPGKAVLTRRGRKTLTLFAILLGKQLQTQKARLKRKQEDEGKMGWRRIRIEGHTRYTGGQDFLLSAQRAEEVRQVFANYIRKHFLAIAGRGGETPLDPRVKRRTDVDRRDPRNERVEIVVEFGNLNALNERVSRSEGGRSR